jgi:hypothetical protein
MEVCTGCDKEKDNDGFKRCSYCREQRRRDYQKNKEKENAQSRAYHERNKQTINARHIEYNKTHKDSIKTARNKRYHTKLKKDKRFKLDGTFSNAIRKELRRRKLKKEEQWETILGYNIEQLMAHLESKFDETMTWDNYGTYWHIDHVRPKTWFNYESINDETFKECWALSNLQPLEAKKNSQKGNRFEG